MLNDGGGYNPTSDTWLPLTPTGAPAARYQHTAVWTGSQTGSQIGNQMLVCAGAGENGGLVIYLNDNYSYNPPENLFLYQKP